MADHRSRETQQEREERIVQNKQSMADYRSRQTQQEREERNLQDKHAKAKKRTTVAFKEALESVDIMHGKYAVLGLENTEDGIGKMEVSCISCKAQKFEKETGSTCCSKGKVDLDSFPKPKPKSCLDYGMPIRLKAKCSVKIQGLSTMHYV